MRYTLAIIICYKYIRNVYVCIEFANGSHALKAAIFMKILQCDFDDQRKIIMKLFFLFVILVQVWTALGTRCRTNGGQLGICKLLNECNVQYDMSQLLAKCANTGLHCCPNQSRVSLPTSKVSSVDPVPVTLPTTPRVPVQTNQATFTLATRSKFPTDCGDTPKYPKVQIVGGKEIKPDEYSWLASLQYGNNVTVGSCGASVINSRYLLTAAHCVTGSRVRRAGGL